MKMNLFKNSPSLTVQPHYWFKLVSVLRQGQINAI